jgi:hypothetical protein
VNLTDFSCAGYFIIRASPPPWNRYDATVVDAQYPHVERISNKVLSLSDCVCPKFSVSWGWIPESPTQAQHFGISPTAFGHYKRWCNESPHAPKVSGVFNNPSDARICVRELKLDTTDLWIIGCGLPNWQLPDDNIKLTKEPANDIEGNLQRRLPLDPTGEFIGFDLVYQWLPSVFDCSWLCHPYTFQPIHDDPTVNFTELGLIANEASALHAYQIQPNKPGDVEFCDYWLMYSYNLDD